MKPTLERLPRFQIRNFVRSYAFTQPTMSGVLTVGQSRIAYRTDLEDMTIEFTATDPDGNQVVSKWGLMQRASNLGKGNMWFFYSFRSGKPCRVLYLVDGKVVSRNDMLCPRYKQQLMGRSRRKWKQVGRYLNPPVRPNGKRTYRGRLTPYGKRLKRYNERAEYYELFALVYLTNRFQLWECNSILEPLKGMEM